MTWDDIRKIALALPGVEAASSYGTPAFKVAGKLLTRLRTEDASLVLLDVTFDEREMLIAAEPQTFHLTDHYKDYPAVLARMEGIDPGSLAQFLERRWRKVAPRRIVKAHDQAGS